MLRTDYVKTACGPFCFARNLSSKGDFQLRIASEL